MTDVPLFSVVMATYDRGRHIIPSIQSVLGQSLQDFELVIVGDRCTDETEAAVRPLLSDKVRWLNQVEHCGSQSAPNNAGIAAARGATIAYIGHDDIWSENHLAALHQLLAADADVDFAVSGAIYHMPRGVNRAQVTGMFDDDTAKFTHFFPPTSFAHRRAVVAKIGGWPDPQEIKPPVDAELLLRAARAGLRFRSTNMITAHKFAAGHRYLSYLRHGSHEQEAMLVRMREPGFEAYVEDQVNLARATGGYMAVRYFDFEPYAPGQLARENAARKGALKPPLLALRTRQIVPQPEVALAWDWTEIMPDGLRWSGLNPRPKLLLPFTADGPARVEMVLAHDRADALDRLTICAGAELISARLGGVSRVADHWQAVASFAVNLAKEDYTILELELEGIQRAKAEARGLGIGQILIEPEFS